MKVYVQGIRIGAHVSRTLHGELLHATLPPDAPGLPSHAGPPPAIAELRITRHPAAAVDALLAAQQHWRAAGLEEFALLDTVRTVVGEGAVLSLRRAPGHGAVSVRTAIHDGVRADPFLAPLSACSCLQQQCMLGVPRCWFKRWAAVQSRFRGA